MKSIYFFIIICLVTFGCIHVRNEKEKISYDTVYATNIKTDKQYKKPIIQLRSGSLGLDPFQLKSDTINYIQINVLNYPDYPIHLKNIQNLTIENSFPDQGKFYVQPLDTICQFDIYLDFGENNALLKYESNTGEYKYQNFDGLQFMGRVRESVIK